MNELTFGIAFYGPFRIATGNAGRGVDATVDLDCPLPASSLKGLMRAGATSLFSQNLPLVDDVFGVAPTQSPWAWSDAVPSNGTITVDRFPSARVRIDPHTGTALEDHLQMGEIAWLISDVPTGQPRARFTVSRQVGLPAEAQERHRLVLRASAGHVHSLGNQRRRGLGWVHLQPEPAIGKSEVWILRSLQERRA